MLFNTQNTQVAQSNKYEQLEEVLDTEKLEGIFPFSWIEEKKHIETGENFTKTLCIVDYPSGEIRDAYLSPILKKGGNIEITTFFRPADIETMISHINDSIKNKETELIRVTDPRRRAQLKREVSSSQQQLNKFIDDKTGFLYMYMYITIKASNLERLESLERDIKATLTKVRLTAHSPTNAMREAFQTALPLNHNFLKPFTQQNMDTDSAGHFFLFDDSEIINLNENASLIGINKNTDSLVSIDYADKTKSLNQNRCILGTSGVGKSTFMFQSIIDDYTKGIKNFIIDPENEYSQVVSKLGGTVITLSTASTVRINPFEIFSTEVFDEDDDTDLSNADFFGEGTQNISDVDILVRTKIGTVKTFLKALKADMTQVEMAIVSSLLKDIYTEKGFTGGKRFEDFSSEDYPTITDLYNALTDLRTNDVERYKEVKTFHYVLEDYTNEYGTTNIFDGFTNISLDKDIISFNLKPLQTEKEVQSAAYINVFSYLWDEVTKDKTTAINIKADELHFMASNSEALDFFYQAYKRCRKYASGATVSTQQIKDILKTDGEFGAAIIENSFTKFFFGMDDSGVTELIERLDLKFSSEEVKHLRKKRKGEVLTIYGSQRAFLKVQLSQEEMRLWDTEQYEKVYSKSANEQPQYVEMVGISEIERDELLEEISTNKLISVGSVEDENQEL